VLAGGRISTFEKFTVLGVQVFEFNERSTPVRKLFETFERVE
jgi:hypothetical protein